MCDGKSDCIDDSDEERCEQWACVQGSIKCADMKQCVKVKLIFMFITDPCCQIITYYFIDKRLLTSVLVMDWTALMDLTNCVMTHVFQELSREDTQ